MDVIGHEDVVAILVQCVSSGKGFEQSYAFGGKHGGGKTTLARILARALLCKEPQKGHPCDKCVSCKSMLERGSSENFFEIDAATNSGKEDVKGIIEQISYSTFSGKRKIYLFDEAHRLSREAFDALLKPMEEVVYGTSEKRLICIFATTEPTKMRKTILSRCAPLFFLPHLSSERIADRLAFICEEEKIHFEKEALVMISELRQNHIRDSIKTLEMLSMIGGVTVDLVNEQFHFILNDLYLTILEGLSKNPKSSISAVKEILVYHSPSEIYSKLAELCWLCFSSCNGWEDSGTLWKRERLEGIYQKLGDKLIRYAEFFSGKPYNPTGSMICCDIMLLSGTLVSSKVALGALLPLPPPPSPPSPPSPSSSPPLPSLSSSKEPLQKKSSGTDTNSLELESFFSGDVSGVKKETNNRGKVERPCRESSSEKAGTRAGVYINPKQVRKTPSEEEILSSEKTPEKKRKASENKSFSPQDFKKILRARFLQEKKGRIDTFLFGNILKIVYDYKRGG